MERGCLAQLDNATIADCDSETCQICVGAQMPGQPNGCNVGLFPSNRLLCHICSGGINSTCAGRIEATATPCPLFAPDDQCYVARPNGGYERGCLSSTRRCDSERCFVCEGHRCNFVDFSGASNLFPTTKILSFAIISFIIAKFN